MDENKKDKGWNSLSVNWCTDILIIQFEYDYKFFTACSIEPACPE
jgi:hypothetical protein